MTIETAVDLAPQIDTKEETPQLVSEPNPLRPLRDLQTVFGGCRHLECMNIRVFPSRGLNGFFKCIFAKVSEESRARYQKSFTLVLYSFISDK